MMPFKKKKIGEILVEKGIISLEQLELALKEQARTKEIFGKILVKRGFVKESDLLLAVSEQFGIPRDTLANKYVDWEFVKNFTSSLIVDLRCLPLSRDDESLTVAIADPLNMAAIKKAESEAGGRALKLILVTESDMDDIIKRYKQFRKADIAKMFEKGT